MVRGMNTFGEYVTRVPKAASRAEAASGNNASRVTSERSAAIDRQPSVYAGATGCGAGGSRPEVVPPLRRPPPGAPRIVAARPGRTAFRATEAEPGPQPVLRPRGCRLLPGQAIR